MASYPIADMKSVGSKYARKLKAVGIRSTRTLLKRAGTPKARRQLAAESGIDETLVLKWANMADLMRIKGVAEEYSELLEAAGVETVKELKRRNAGNLAVKMAEINEARRLVRVVPTEKRISGWIAYAQALEPMMTH